MRSNIQLDIDFLSIQSNHSCDTLQEFEFLTLTILVDRNYRIAQVN